MSSRRMQVDLPTRKTIDDLAVALRNWWDAEQKKWTEVVDDDSTDPDLWDDMPVIESKQVARTTTLFEEHLGMKLDVKLIRPGGYASIDDLIQDLLPKMAAKILAKATKHRRSAA